MKYLTAITLFAFSLFLTGNANAMETGPAKESFTLSMMSESLGDESVDSGTVEPAPADDESVKGKKGRGRK